MTTNTKPNPIWNKLPRLVINNYEFNHDKSLIVFATNTGYRVVDTIKNTIVSKVDDVQEMIGPLSKASVLYNSQFICFLGKEDNFSFPRNQLVFWDESKRRKIGMLMLKENIDTFYLTRNVVIVVTNIKILLFELIGLKFVSKIDNVLCEESLISIMDKNPMTIGYISTDIKTLNIITMIKFKIDTKKGVVQSRNKIGVITQFEKIKHIQFPENNDEVIICVSQYENKLHVYSTFDNILLYCVFLGQMMMTISNIFIDSKIKFLIFELDNDEVHLYKLKGNEAKFACGCKEHSDTEIRKRRKDSKNSFFGGLITKMFTDSNVAHLTVDLTQGHKEVKVIRIDNNDKECLIIGDSDGVLRKIKFDRKKEMTIKEQREIKLFEYE